MKRNFYYYFLFLSIAVFCSLAGNTQRTASVSGPWNSVATWGGQSVPNASHNVVIAEGINVTITADAACNNLIFRRASGSLTVNAGIKLDVGDDLTLENRNGASTAALLAGAGTINITNSLRVGGTVSSPTADYTAILTTTVATINIGGNIIIRSEDRNDFQGNSTLRFDQGYIKVDGDVIVDADSDGGAESTASLAMSIPALGAAKLWIGGAGGMTAPGAGEVSVDIENSGVTVEYGGASQTVFGTHYNNLIISGTGTKTLNGSGVWHGTLNLNGGNFAVGNNFSAGTLSNHYLSRGNGTITGTLQGTVTYSVYYSGSSKLSGDETSGNVLDLWLNIDSAATITLTRDVFPHRDVIIAHNARLDMSTFRLDQATPGNDFAMGSNTVLRIAGPNNFPKDFSHYFINGDRSTIEYYGHDQVIAALPGISSAYCNLILSGSGVKTMENEQIRSLLSVRGTATIAGVSPTYIAGAMLEYMGSVAQTTTDIEFPGAGNIPTLLKINNPNGVTLNGAKSLDGQLILENGYLTTTTTNLLTINSAGTATSSNGSFVNGPLEKVMASASLFTFPVGNLNRGLRAVGVTPQDATLTTYRAAFVDANPQSISTTMSGGLSQISNCEYWDISQISGTTPARVTLSWNSAGNNCGNIGSIPAQVVAHYSGSAWTNEGQSSFTGTVADGGTITSNNYVNTFSPFTLGTISNFQSPLPVMFADVKAFQKNSGVQIEWTNLTERDLIKYQVERSSNGQSFTTVVNEQLPRSNNNDKERYTAFDASPLTGANFYRVKVYEIGGKIIYSKILKVDMSGKASFTLYPNPVDGGQVSVSMTAKQGQYTVKVINAAGQEIHVQRLSHQGGAMTQTIDLPSSVKPGVYNMVITSTDYRETKTFIVQ